ncbi:MAG: demethoxyubiquinone hydroxylase family protein [Alphaproteobacteria bacterium]|nr:demethoxyubiquinone hydroxylase family protein [Alphaproteobacteria bacterium]
MAPSPDPGRPASRKPPARPGETAPRQRRAAMLRVDHAGEHGAVRIYEGQLAVLGQSPATARSAALVRKMAAQEEAHLATFDRLLGEERVRPTLLAPVWHVAGFALGAATALIGEKAAMACTAAVEEAIDDHYAAQSAELGAEGGALKDTIDRFRADEAEHRQTALAEGAERAPAYPLMSALIRAGCRAAIRLSERV